MKIAEALGSLAFLAALPMIVGTGFFFFQVGRTWTPGNTTALIGGLIAVCAGGGVISLVLFFVIFLVMAAMARERYNEKFGGGNNAVAYPMPYEHIPPGYAPVEPARIGVNPTPAMPDIEDDDDDLGQVIPAGVTKDEWD